MVLAHLATGCGIKAKDPSGLDSDQWIPHSRCCKNPARAKALAGIVAPPLSGIHWSESSPSGSFAIEAMLTFCKWDPKNFCGIQIKMQMFFFQENVCNMLAISFRIRCVRWYDLCHLLAIGYFYYVSICLCLNRFAHMRLMFQANSYVIFQILHFTHCGLVTPYGIQNLAQHWFRYWFVDY